MDVAGADYVVAAMFGIGSPQDIPLGTLTIPLANGWTSVIPRSRTEYFRWLIIGAAPAESFKEEVTPSIVEWAWIAHIGSSGTSGDLRAVIDMLLVAGLDYFGRSSGRIVTVALSDEDRRIVALRTSGP